MKIYGIEDEATAIQLAQLMKLNSECVKLQWSRTIKNIPQTVKNALEIIESFVETRVTESCTNALLGEMTDEEEAALLSVLKTSPQLRNSLGSGVVLAGEQATEVKKNINALKVPKLIIDALDSGKNVIIF